MNSYAMGNGKNKLDLLYVKREFKLTSHHPLGVTLKSANQSTTNTK